MERTYTVKPGDTLSEICERELGNYALWSRVAAYNKLPDPHTIMPGQIIKFPGARA